MLMEVRVEPQVLSIFAERFRDGLPFTKVARPYMEYLGREVAENLRRFTPIGGTGQLSESTDYTVRQEGKEFVVIITQDARNPRQGSVYRPFVVRGTRPHLPPYRNLIEWVEAKWRPINPVQVAYRLARHISHYGTRANPFNEPALRVSQPVLQEVANELVAEIVARPF